MEASSRFFENKKCEYYPCHKDVEEVNCLFCYCPMYLMTHCPGKPEYMDCNGKTIKNCSNCTFPHEAENYDVVMQFLTKEYFK